MIPAQKFVLTHLSSVGHCERKFVQHLILHLLFSDTVTPAVCLSAHICIINVSDVVERRHIWLSESLSQRF